ncbi:MAG: DUF3078 domain-containing protein [Candidatus Moranbacteria bacterium]|nr:DUF3078 domain-containing protein [Candidatus Moranbacteria bacterium]
MKYIALTIAVMLGMAAFAQEEENTGPWKTSGIASFTVNQASFSNWSAGGENSIATMALFKFFGDYTKDNFSINNSATFKYGLLKNESEPLKKSEDLIELNSQFNQKFSDNWSASGLINFTSQFANGYNYPDTSTVVSKFLSPAYLTVAPGILYKPVDYFSILMSPASLRTIFVMDQDLADLGAFGVDPAEIDTVTGNKISDGENVKVKLGAFVEFYFKKEIKTDLSFESKLNFFYNYLPDDVIPEGAAPLDVHWQNFINYKLNNWFSANLFVHLAYIPGDVRIESVPPVGGIGENKIEVKANDKMQLKQTFGIGFAYNF